MRLKPETRADICTLLEEGVDKQEIASGLDVTVKTVESVERAMAREKAREEERVSANRDRVLAGDKYNGIFRSIAPNTFEGTCRLSDGTFERKRFEGLRSAAQEGWEEWCAGLREREQWVERQEPQPFVKQNVEWRAVETQASPGEVAQKPQAVESTASVYILTVAGKNVGLFRDVDRAMAIADRLGGALGMEYDVSEISFWEGE